MPAQPLNVLLDRTLPVGGTLSLPYPEGRNEGHFFSAVNHTLSVEGVFFRSPRDFTIVTQPDRILFTWHGKFALAAGALLNLQLEIPGGDFYRDPKTNISIANMVLSPLFMLNLGTPWRAEEHYWMAPTLISAPGPLQLVSTQPQAMRNVVIRSSSDSSHCTFTIEGEDCYQRVMIEKIVASASGMAEGKKAFARVTRITSSHPCNGEVWIGTGNKLGLPVFLPAPGYLLREIIAGIAVTGGTIVSGETAPPTATTGDRRGTYTPPPTTELDGKHSIHLLLSLPVPGNIGIPDYAG